MLRINFLVLLVGLMPVAEAGVSVFDADQSVNLGERFDDQPLRYHLVLDNPSDLDVEKLEVETSCGCTEVRLESKTIKARTSTTVDVTIDLLGKRGRIEKILELTFLHGGKSRRQQIKIEFIARARVGGHAKRSLQDHLFKGKCARCHAEPAVGKYGEALFTAVCGSCHGNKAGGASASGFNRLDYLESMDPDKVRKQIHDGVGDGESMPGFSKQRGGPLSDEQIESLVDYFIAKKANWKKLMKRRYD